MGRQTSIEYFICESLETMGRQMGTDIPIWDRLETVGEQAKMETFIHDQQTVGVRFLHKDKRKDVFKNLC
jgi:hypothetical protein